MSPNDWNTAIIEEFRANGGQVKGHQFPGSPLLLLHTIGAKSGKSHLNPAAYIMDGNRYVIIASMGGAPKHPDWYYNILAHPTVSVELGTEQFQAQASVVEEPERTRLYNEMASIRPSFKEYEKKTDRVIPVIILTRTK
jgi:deazaflavin-dependent oxidoreductase (nitroreductase family)